MNRMYFSEMDKIMVCACGQVMKMYYFKHPEQIQRYICRKCNKKYERDMNNTVEIIEGNERKNEMKLNTYQELATRTANHEQNFALANWGLGIAGEAGEVADLIKKSVFHNHNIDAVEIKKELGDVLWYVSQIATAANISLEEVATANIEKLKKRYPNGFSTEDSINRIE